MLKSHFSPKQAAVCKHSGNSYTWGQEPSDLGCGSLTGGAVRTKEYWGGSVTPMTAQGGLAGCSML
jgi:hypothetical protein